ncbi:uncharacterized protein LY79DRAFT_571918 [Colletotrichum navitas]|uniref:Uncharacterized protein n=1 Tax=Colletotrichum navitas TaxID=681940 RepID=A0AAD8PL06_9PEZI|nr:uncharacterized protein LY79DRAFT_571918 [Colletotrichum navitas]KAK1569440.1 hypothetical protein LY79DRAFT_571918 [Colletotrichum navitas]
MGEEVSTKELAASVFSQSRLMSTRLSVREGQESNKLFLHQLDKDDDNDDNDDNDNNSLYSDTDELFQQLKHTFPTENDSVMTVRCWIASLMSRRGLCPGPKFMLPWTGRELHHPSLDFAYVVKVFKFYGVDDVSVKFLVKDLVKCREVTACPLPLLLLPPSHSFPYSFLA